MASVLESVTARDAGRSALVRWAPVLAGLLALYAPTYVTLAHGAWNDEQNAHGPIVLAVVLWLAWQKRAALTALPEQGAPLAGGVLLAAGLLLYVAGRALEFIYFDAGSQIAVLAGVLLAIHGWRGVRLMWFPLLYMIFLVPLPGVIVDAATGALKQWVSFIAENLLYHAGYPIARSGVVLTIGHYQLLIADACSGINSMYSLTALGLLFLYLTYDGGWLRAGILLAAIWPIAFAANIVRVLTLVLVTYYLGDEAGQGFLHGFSGILLFVVALLLLFGLQWLLAAGAARRVSRLRARPA